MNFKFIYLTLFASSLCTIHATLSDKRLCVDEKCSVPISTATPLITYSAAEAGHLSFKSGDEITIYSKEAGNNLNLWGAEINGKRGYVPLEFVREKKMLNPNPSVLVDTEHKEVPSIELNQPEALIIDGTTLYADIAPSTTEKHVPPNTATTVPQENTPIAEEFEGSDKNEELKHSKEEESQDDDDDIEIDVEEGQDADDDEDFEDNDEDEEQQDLSEDSKKANSEIFLRQTQPSPNLSEVINKISNKQPLELKKVDTNAVKNILTNATVDRSNENNDNQIINSESPLEDKGVTENGQRETRKTEKAESSTANIPGLPLFLDSIQNPNLDTNIVPEKHLDDINTVKIRMVPNSDYRRSIPSPDSIPPTGVPIFFHNSLSNDPSASEQLVSEDIKATTGMPTVTELDEKSVSQNILDFEESNPDSLTTQDIKGDMANKIVDFKDSKESNAFNKRENGGREDSDLNVPSESEHNLKTQDYNTGSISGDDKKTNKVESIPRTSIGNDNDITENDIQKDHVSGDISSTESLKFGESVSEEGQGGGFFEFFSSSPTESSSSITNEDSQLTEPQLATESAEDQIRHVNVYDDITTEIPQSVITEITEESGNFKMNRAGVSEYTTESSVEVSDTSDLNQETSEAPHSETIDYDSSYSEKVEETSEESWFDSILKMFGGLKVERSTYAKDLPNYHYIEKNDDVLLSHYTSSGSCSVDGAHCHSQVHRHDKPEMLHSDGEPSVGIFDFLELNDTIIIVALSGACVVLFLLGYMLIEKMRKEGPLVGKINELEHYLLILRKENEVLSTKLEDVKNNSQAIKENVSSELVHEMQKELDDANIARASLEDQLQSLEKELENSTEVGLELNRMLSDVLSSQNGSDAVMANIEQLQKQLVEQQATINNVNSKLNEKDTENHELQLELEINNKKVVDLQAELEKMMLNLLKVEEEKDMAVTKAEVELADLRALLTKIKASLGNEIAKTVKELTELKQQLIDVQRKLDLKTKEYNLLRESLSDSDSNKSALDQSTLKAELLQFQQDNKSLNERLTHDQVIIKNFESQVVFISNENQNLTKRFEDADKEKLEALTKLEVLSTYFKEKEAELQRELSKHEAMWTEKQGEASSTTERLKFMQEEIQNFKTQVASLQQEIVSQEVALKSQISVLEKKAHENWVAARQAERKIEDARQESAQLRNRLTLRERSLNEEKSQNRNGLQSPLEANGIEHLSPMHVNDTPASPPLLFGTREHLTTSPPIPGLPPGFPLPPPGVPFMPPPLPGMPPFMPPPPSMFPGDHRPPPLGRMSSPPINSRYTPDSRAYSPYDRHSPSPTDEEYYDRNSFYNQRTSKRGNSRRSGYSTGSNSNESLDKLDRQHSKV